MDGFTCKDHDSIPDEEIVQSSQHCHVICAVVKAFEEQGDIES
jgi:hypothetical protein